MDGEQKIAVNIQQKRQRIENEQKERESDPFFIGIMERAKNYKPKLEEPKKKGTKTEVFNYLVSEIKKLIKKEDEDKKYNNQNEAFYSLLAGYIAHDKYFKENTNGLIKNKPSLKKGLLISSPVGVGKTSIIKIFVNVTNYKLVNLIDIKDDWDQLHSFNCTNRHQIKNKYCSRNVMLFVDEAGREEKTSNRKYVLEEIIEIRHKKGLNISLLSNNNLNELKYKYGEYVSDRLNQMCNIIELKGKSLRD